MPKKIDYTPHLQKTARKTGKYAEVLKNLDKCVFCDLRQKYIIDEVSNVVLSVNLFPYIDGHLVIIPRRHLAKFSELKVKEWEAVKILTERALALLEKAYGVRDLNFVFREGEKSGKTVWHLHFNLIPYKEGLLEWCYQEILKEPIKVAEELRSLTKDLNLESKKS